MSCTVRRCRAILGAVILLFAFALPAQAQLINVSIGSTGLYAGTTSTIDVMIQATAASVYLASFNLDFQITSGTPGLVSFV